MMYNLLVAIVINQIGQTESWIVYTIARRTMMILSSFVNYQNFPEGVPGP